MTEPTLEQQIIAAGLEVGAAKRARPRDPERIEAALAELERLRALQDA
jgi:hypothetical protein